MKLYEQKGYNEKEALNIRTEEQKIADIELLKNQNPPGPFTRSNRVFGYLGCDHNDVIKNKRLYVEIQLAKKNMLVNKTKFLGFQVEEGRKKLDV